jgi:hypothetical protein
MIVSIFEHGVFSNFYTNWGVLISLSLGISIVYFPPFQYVDGSGGAVFGYIMLVTAACFIALWSWSEARKFIVRTQPESALAYCLRW